MSPRIPIDSLVELEGADGVGPEGQPEVYDADALDVSATGLRLRSVVLPDIGQRLRARFELPEAGVLQAEGEVVWASDEGATQGEFAVRFDGVDARTKAALARWSRARGSEVPVEVESSKASGSAWVALDGVQGAIACDIVRREETRLEVRQALPMFELGRFAQVTADGGVERRRLEGVRVQIEDGVPQLVFSLVAEVSSAGSIEAPTDAADHDAEAAPVDSEATLQDRVLAELVSTRASDKPTSVADEIAKIVEAERALPVKAKDNTKSRARRELFRADESVDDPSGAIERKRKLEEVRRVLLDGDELAEAPPSPPLFDALREKASALLGTARPRVQRGWVQARTAGSHALELAGPRVRSSWAWLRDQWTGLLALLRERLPMLARKLPGIAPKRRTTPVATSAREAPRRAQRVAGRPAPAVEPSRPAIPLRYVLAAALVLGLVFAIAALWGGDDDATPAVPLPPTPVAASLPAPVGSIEPPAAVPALAPIAAPAPPAAPAVAPRPRALPPIEPPPPPTAMGDAPTEEGRLPMPGSPTIPGAIQARAAATAAPPATSVGRSFGAERVEEGRTTVLEMSLPPSGLEGQADPSGFTVTIRGALSNTRAAQIARTNPAVDRASVINRGDHAVLDVRFVEGRAPAYRVAIEGQSVHVTIGR